MILRQLYSPDIYYKIMQAEQSKKENIYRYEMMQPFQGKWDCYHIPLKASHPGGYDIIMANDRLGLFAPSKVDLSVKPMIDAIADPALWDACRATITGALTRFEEKGIAFKVQEYLFSVFLANPQNPYTVMNEGYCGDGGIPGYIMGWLVPGEKTIRKLPAALAHEANHNVRYQYIKWTNDITLGEMLVSEGLAENYAVTLFGKEFLGPWVSKTDPELLPLIKEILRDALQVTGFDNITSYLYGDEMARLQSFPETGLPYCAGYATGYYLVRHYLQKTGISIEKATVLPCEEILKDAEDFWTM
ncbi:MAG: DUF2268 domain-containing protein [Lachnospiraceae bacterium]|nr:DUF2268 domain-containing protein [Lachnospiraceae bacterium]